MDYNWNFIYLYILRYIKLIIRVSHAEDEPSLSFCITFIISLLTHSTNIGKIKQFIFLDFEITN